MHDASGAGVVQREARLAVDQGLGEQQRAVGRQPAGDVPLVVGHDRGEPVGAQVVAAEQGGAEVAVGGVQQGLGVRRPREPLVPAGLVGIGERAHRGGLLAGGRHLGQHEVGAHRQQRGEGEGQAGAVRGQPARRHHAAAGPHGDVVAGAEVAHVHVEVDAVASVVRVDQPLALQVQDDVHDALRAQQRGEVVEAGRAPEGGHVVDLEHRQLRVLVAAGVVRDQDGAPAGQPAARDRAGQVGQAGARCRRRARPAGRCRCRRARPGPGPARRRRTRARRAPRASGRSRRRAGSSWRRPCASPCHGGPTSPWWPRAGRRGCARRGRRA